MTGLFWFAVAACLRLHLMWPGDAPFINDEPALLHAALDADRTDRLATEGALGTVGVRYGPLPTWLYQIALMATHDVVAIVLLKSLLSFVATLAGVLLICRWVGASRWLALTVAVSPFLWLYDRMLWDLVFQIPVSVWAVAAYLGFGRRRSGWRLLAVVLPLAALAGIHLMSLPTLAGFSLCLLWLDGRWLLREWRRALPAVVAGAVLCVPYAWYVVHVVQFGRGEHTSLGSALGAGLTSGGIFSFLGFHEYYDPTLSANAGLLNGSTREALALVSGSAIAAVLAGIAIAGWLLLRRRSASRDEADGARRAAALGLSIFGFALLMFVVLRRQLHPHFYAGSACGVLLLLLLCGRAVWKFLIARIVFGLYLAVMTVLLLDLSLALHRNGGDLSPTYGPTIGNQVEVAGQAVRMVRGGARTVVLTGPYSMFPWAFTTLFRLDSAWNGAPLVYRSELGAGYVRLTLDGGAMGLGPANDAGEILVGMLPGPPVRLAAVSRPPRPRS